MQQENKSNGKKDAVIILRLTPEEKQKAHQVATESGATVSGMIRELLKKSKIRK